MQISLGTGLAPGRPRGGAPPPVAGAPALVRAPALVGDGRIGARLAADPGDWTGAARFEFAWLKDGAPIAGAAGPDYAPRAADDRAALACRVTAVGTAGRATAETPAIAAAFPPPQPTTDALPDLIFPQATGFHIMDASPFFSGAALGFSISGDGVSIDPATGLVTISLAALRAGAAIRVVAENSGGRAELGFTLKVTPAAVAPILTRAPELAGTGLVGAELALDPGLWAGEPAPELTLQWLRDGAEIAGAAGDRFTPGDAEDGTAVAARVTARNDAGELAAETAAIAIARAAPAAIGGLADVVLAQGAAAPVIPVAAAFAGAALRFAVAGGGAAIDPATGALTLPTDARRAAETVTVTATNSGGAAVVAFAVRVLAAPAASGAPEAAVFAVGAAATVAAGGFFSGDALVFALDAGPEGVTIDPATGLVTVPTGAALEGVVTVRARNAVGTAAVEFAVRVLAAPAASGAPEAAVFAVGAAATVAAGGFFSGDALVFALDAGPEGVTIDPATGLVTVPTGAALEGVVTVRARNAVGTAAVEFAVRVLAAPAASAVTVFDAPEKLAEVSLVQRNAVPSWTHDPAGWAVFSPGKPNDFTHGAWAGGRGDGRYRALVRINHSAATLASYTRSRPFGINGRMARTGADLRGIRVELDRRVDGTTAFEIREYTGVGEATTLLGAAPVAWAYDVWYWMETEFDGPALRARLYPATDAAPAWQATATTASQGAGYFGPMSTVFNTVTFPIIQIQRLEYHPLVTAGEGPRQTAPVADARGIVGAPLSVDVGAAVTGSGLSWSAAVDGGPLPAGWAISPAGVLTAPTGAAFARRSVTVTATDALGRAVSVSFAVEVDPAAPRLTGVLPDVPASVGDAVRVDFGAIVEGTGLVFTVDRPWTIDAGGALTVPTAAPFDGAVTVTATDALARAVSATFRVTVRAPALVLTAPVANVAAVVGEARTVDVGALVTPKAGLTWTSSRPAWALSAAGVLTIPTTAALAAAAVSVTASDAFGQSVTATFQVSVAAPPLTVTTVPTLAAAVAPGTALGSVWNIAGGAFAGGVAPIVTERRFLRDGAAIAGFGAATAYTVVAADQGKTITAQVRRTDSSVPPQVLTVDVAGAAVIPAAVPPLTVTTAPTLAAAVAPGTALGSVWNIAGGAFAGGVAPIVTERRFLRDGAAIAGFGAATAYTVVAADQGKTITAQVRRTDSAVPPQVLTVDVAGAAVIPAAVPPLTVTTAPTFAAAVAPGTALGSVWNIAGGAFAGGVAPIVTERRFLRDGAAIAGFGAATAYTVVAADRGKTITAQVRRTDSSVPPQVLTVDATGAAVIPGVAPAADFTVNTTAQLLAAMVTAAGQAGPKVIACQPGNYAALTRTNALVKVGKAANGTNVNNRVTVISADRNNPATWRDTSWSLQNLDGFTFDGLRFLGTTDDGLGFAKLGVQAINCQNLTNVTFRNCAWDGWCDNLAVTRSVNLTIEWNDMKGAGRDSVRLFDRHQNLLVQHNDFDGFRADGSPGVDYTRSQSDDPNRHADFLSIQISTVAARGGINMRILNNKFRSGNGYHQGFFCANSMLQGGADFNTYKTTGLVCAGNWFEMCHVNCLYISGCEDFVCENNLLRRIPAPGKGYWDATALGQPTLVLAALSSGAVTDVVSHRAIKLDARMPNLNQVAVRNYAVDTNGTARPADLPAPPPVGAYGYE